MFHVHMKPLTIIIRGGGTKGTKLISHNSQVVGTVPYVSYQISGRSPAIGNGPLKDLPGRYHTSNHQNQSYIAIPSHACTVGRR